MSLKNTNMKMSFKININGKGRRGFSRHFILSILSCCFLVFISACTSEKKNSNQKIGFESIPSTESGLDFSNMLDEEKLKSVFNYINAYTGAGVAIGDINNDGLQDIYMTANMSSSKLFLNKGDMEFEDITTKSGTGTTGWSSAVTMADVNNDGWVDIYVCRSYHDNPTDRMNQMFINNQDGTFTDKSQEMGINDENYSIAASFFDYDRDGDLDLIVGNHPRFRMVSLATHYNYWLKPVKKFSNRLYRNDGPSGDSGANKFTEVTEEAGILTYGFTLGLSTSDLNVDGWPDLTITVDHDEPDIFFRNNGDGTFTNVIDEATNQTSLSSMGIDAGDLNHDQYPDLFVAEMLSEDHYREKVSMGMQTVKRFQYLVDTLDYKYYQMHNFLYVNNGNGSFSDMAQLAGVHKSDWSWASFFFDFDNDSWQDLYVVNGLYKEIFNKDRRNKLDEVMIALNGDMSKMNQVAKDYSINAPQQKIANYLFRNNGDLTFEKYANKVGLTEATISTGAAYGDLDNDGDIDLVVNNLGAEALLYENYSKSTNNHLRVAFQTNEKSPLGAKVYIKYKDDFQSRELLATRGFLSSCEPLVHFGLGNVAVVEKLEIIWPDGKMQTINNVKANTTINASYSDAKQNWTPPNRQKEIVKNIDSSSSGLDYVQDENDYHDYDDQVLLPHKMSESGPFISKGDVNNDGLDDVYFGSPHQQAGALYIQKNDGSFSRSKANVFNQDKNHEDGHSIFFDADGDGDQDLAVSSTGYEFNPGDALYQPRLYLNDGKGNFKKSKNAFSEFRNPSSCMEAKDFDGDGDLDLFIGGHQEPKKYPNTGISGFFLNDGKGKFTEATETVCPDLKEFGMVKDALWTDLNADKKPDLIVVGEWTPISFWIQEDGKLVDRTADYFSTPLTGWWNCIQESDLDGNGLTDYVIGNLGLNYKYKASMEKPFAVYATDFDKNGTQDIVLATYYGDVMYPVRGKSCSTEQIPSISDKFPSFEDYANADLNTVYGEDLEDAVKYEVNQFASVILFQDEPGQFSVKELNIEAQKSPVNGIIIKDINNDNLKDIIVAGNLFQSEIETGRADSGTGLIMLNKGDKNFETLPVYKSGLYLGNDVKSIEYIELGKDKKPALVVGNNKAACELVRLNP